MQSISKSISKKIASVCNEIFFITQALTAYDVMSKSDIAIACIHLLRVIDALDKLEFDVKEIKPRA
jgi:hypothetical protein